MADANRGRGRGRGRGQGEEEPRHRDQQDLEIAAMGKRIRELERQLAEARVGSTNREEGEESDTIDSSEAGEEDKGFNPWGNPNWGRNQRFRLGNSGEEIEGKVEKESGSDSYPIELEGWRVSVRWRRGQSCAAGGDKNQRMAHLSEMEKRRELSERGKGERANNRDSEEGNVKVKEQVKARGSPRNQKSSPNRSLPSIDLLRKNIKQAQANAKPPKGTDLRERDFHVPSNKQTSKFNMKLEEKINSKEAEKINFCVKSKALLYILFIMWNLLWRRLTFKATAMPSFYED
ncbi:hypothetical protein Droror1_Dr00022126 [Drosera rotundifolia]